MSDAGHGLRYFLVEYKKRLPQTEENKEFHEHLDFMIAYFESSHIIYLERWDDWISPNDERYWRNPNAEERAAIVAKHVKQAEEKRRGGSWVDFLRSLF